MINRSEKPTHDTLAAPLLLKTREACKKLGGIHPRSLSRMEKAGLLRSVKLLRHKLYAIQDLEALVESLRDWNKEAAR